MSERDPRSSFVMESVMVHMGHPSAPYLSLGIRLSRPIDLGSPLVSPLMEIPLLVPCKSCLGRQRAVCVRLHLVFYAQHAVVVGHA